VYSEALMQCIIAPLLLALAAVDRDEMGRELGIVGADTRGTQGDSLPSAGSQFFDPLWVDGRYAWDWRGMGLCYPLIASFRETLRAS